MPRSPKISRPSGKSTASVRAADTSLAVAKSVAGAPAPDDDHKKRGKFEQALRDILNPIINDKQRRNSALRKRIREVLGISDTTLYLWQNPQKSPKGGGRSEMKPTPKQIVQLGMVICEFNPVANPVARRTDVINHWLSLAGYSLKDVSDSNKASSDTAANRLGELYHESARRLQAVLPGQLREENASLAASCFFSQQLVSKLVAQWKNSGESGHVLVFWKWSANLLNRLEGEPMDALAKLFASLVISKGSTGICINLFVVLDGDEPASHERQDLETGLRALWVAACKPDGFSIFIERTASPRPQHLGDMWIFYSPSFRYPLLFTDYDRLHESLLSLSPVEHSALQAEFNPFVWASHAMLLHESIISGFLRDRMIPLPKPSGPLIPPGGNARWEELTTFKK